MRKLTTKEFIEKSKKIHGDKYDYSFTIYSGIFNTLKIICPIHGMFEQTAKQHLKSLGCVKCVNINVSNHHRKTTLEFIKNAKQIHFDNYDYSKVEYIRAISKVDIKCNKCKEIFKQSPNKHLGGRGCPKCNTMGKVSEPKLFNKIKISFPNENIITQAKPQWLKLQSLDIYFPDYNIGIEYQGKLHFKADKFFGGEKALKENQIRDERKRLTCLNNNCKLLYFTYKKNEIPIDYKYKIYTNEIELLSILGQYINIC